MKQKTNELTSSFYFEMQILVGNSDVEKCQVRKTALKKSSKFLKYFWPTFCAELGM